jgi:hypothetical protein
MLAAFSALAGGLGLSALASGVSVSCATFSAAAFFLAAAAALESLFSLFSFVFEIRIGMAGTAQPNGRSVDRPRRGPFG